MTITTPTTEARGRRPGVLGRRAPGLRVPRHRSGPQRARRAPRRSRTASAREHALVTLLAINGLRVSEALGADIEALGLERGHRTLTVNRKGGKVVTIPLAPRTARAIDLAIGERIEGPIFLGHDAQRLDRHAAAGSSARLARKAGINKPVGPRTLRHAFITAALDAGVPLRNVQEAASHADPRTTMRHSVAHRRTMFWRGLTIAWPSFGSGSPTACRRQR
jgi:integrase/recombinase XerD